MLPCAGPRKVHEGIGEAQQRVLAMIEDETKNLLEMQERCCCLSRMTSMCKAEMATLPFVPVLRALLCCRLVCLVALYLDS
jgi:hypothetical protein